MKPATASHLFPPYSSATVPGRRPNSSTIRRTTAAATSVAIPSVLQILKAQISFYHPDLMTCAALTDLGIGLRACKTRKTPDAVCSLTEVVDGQNETTGVFSYNARGSMTPVNEEVSAGI
ncbi:hypothetical protein PSPO01_01476 [Paraphaeosphaeria sporulosa]